MQRVRRPGAREGVERGSGVKAFSPSTHFSSSWLGGISIMRYSLWQERTGSAAPRALSSPHPAPNQAVSKTPPNSHTPSWPSPEDDGLLHIPPPCYKRARVPREDPQQRDPPGASVGLSSPQQPWAGQSHLGDLTSSVFSTPPEPWHSRYWRSCSERLSC